MTNDNEEPSAASASSLFGLPIRVEKILVGSSWAVVVGGRFLAVSPAMHDLISHATADELQILGEKIRTISVSGEWWDDYRTGWSLASFLRHN